MKPVKKYDLKKKPMDPPSFLVFFAKYFFAEPCVKKHNFKYNKVNMDGLKPPYLLLSNHASEFDFNMLFSVTYPSHVNNIVAIDAIYDHGEAFMRLGGSICKRKFTKETDLLKNMKYAAQTLKNIVCMYPEARYSFDGTTSFLTPALAGLAKYLKIPIVVLNMRGNYISSPQWNKAKYKSVPFEATMSLIATEEEVITLQNEELNKRIADAFVYDDFKYQLDNKIVIDSPTRAKGLHKILYQCPSCNKEHEMYSEGTELWCNSCGKRWEMTELGQLRALSGDDIFTHIPEWFAWERGNVRNEVRSGAYYFEDEVEVQTLPNAQFFCKHGKGRLTHDYNGFKLECTAYGEEKVLEFATLALESIHIEFNYKKMGDAIDLSTLNDSYWLAPLHKRDVIMKLSLATEELHQFETEKKLKARSESKKS